MAGNNGIFMVVDRYESYEAMKTKNPNLQAFAASCPTRLPMAPKVKTLKEIGIDAPYVFNITVAPKSMDETRRKAIAIILKDAQTRVGADEIFKASGMKVPSGSAEQFYSKSVTTVRNLQQKYRTKIEESK
jgi:tripartite-type tricarboxylate transporter receptor subunit TctC